LGKDAKMVEANEIIQEPLKTLELELERIQKMKKKNWYFN
jgi:hypothetical protein